MTRNGKEVTKTATQKTGTEPSPAEPGGIRTQIQVDLHRGAAAALHSHATWAALATVVVLLLKFFFNIQVTSTEILTFAGIMATYLFGSSWVAAAHIDALARLEVKQADVAVDAQARDRLVAFANGLPSMAEAIITRRFAADAGDTKSSPPADG